MSLAAQSHVRVRVWFFARETVAVDLGANNCGKRGQEPLFDGKRGQEPLFGKGVRKGRNRRLTIGAAAGLAGKRGQEPLFGNGVSKGRNRRLTMAAAAGLAGSV